MERGRRSKSAERGRGVKWGHRREALGRRWSAKQIAQRFFLGMELNNKEPLRKTYKQPATLRFEVFTCGAILGRSGHHLVLHIPKTGAATRNESRS